MVYLLARSHYYGPRTGPWTLCVDESGEPVEFASREEAMEFVEQETGLSRNEYARDYRVVEGTVDPDVIQIQRKLSRSRPR